MSILKYYDPYFLLLFDSFLASLILPIKKPLIFKIMCYFGGYNTSVMILIANLASVLGGLTNWCFGYIILYTRIKYHNIFPTENSTIHYTKKLILFFLVLFSWVNICGSIIEVMSGYFKTNIVKVIITTLLSHFFYYIIILYNISDSIY